MKLPYESYTWNFSQHAIALQPNNLFSLLSAASLFEGQSSFGENINTVLIKNRVLTSNIREGKPDAWRDYQQILAETGLIYSTKLERNLRITEAGRLLLAGEIGFSELMSIQALRYQYPNGLKNTFIESQWNSNVLVKPGVLILRILIELYKIGIEPKISVDQCQTYLIPIIRNSDWILGFDKIKNTPYPKEISNKHSRRNVQDWFKFLSVTNIFRIDLQNKNVYIKLTTEVENNIEFYESICLHSELVNTFWTPTTKKSDFISWFDHFGHIPTEYFKLLEENLSMDYIAANYYNSEKSIEDLIIKTRNIMLSEIPHGGINGLAFQNHIIDSKINSGIIKRMEKTKLHDDIVNKLVNYYRLNGYKVYNDKQSIDLLTKSNNGDTAIFEIKTATLRNIFPRSRLAVGQILEYGYRYKQDFGIIPEKNIVFNIDMESQPWLRDYANLHLNIGLISVLGSEIKIFPPTKVK